MGGIATPPVQHWSTIAVGRYDEVSFHHRLDADTDAGAYPCGICDRIVVRGMGAWWLTGGLPPVTHPCPLCVATTQDMAAHMAERHSEGETDWSAWAQRELDRMPGPDAKLTRALRGPIRHV